MVDEGVCLLNESVWSLDIEVLCGKCGFVIVLHITESEVMSWEMRNGRSIEECPACGTKLPMMGPCPI